MKCWAANATDANNFISCTRSAEWATDAIMTLELNAVALIIGTQSNGSPSFATTDYSMAVDPCARVQTRKK